jgi:hypothetical protein
MVETEGVEVPIQVDEKSWSRLTARFDDLDRRMKRTGDTAKREGRTIGAFGAAVVGGTAGLVAGAAVSNPATAGIMDLLVSSLAAALLPVMMQLAGLLELLAPGLEKLGLALAALVEWLIEKHGGGGAAAVALAAYLGYRVGGPAGAAIAAGTTLLSLEAKGGLDYVQEPLTPSERTARGGSLTAPPGTVIYGNDGKPQRTVDPNEKVTIPLGPVGIPVNRERLWGADLVG